MDYEIGPCRVEELPDLAALANRVFRTRRPGDMAREYPLLFDPANCENLRVARAGGRIVAHVGVCLRDASLLGATVGTASIGSVATDPEHRGHGLASRLMTDARAQAVAAGASVMLISGGRGLYHRLGYVEVGEFRRLTVPAGPAREEFTLRVVGEGDSLAAVVGLHQREPVRFVRPLEDWGALLRAGMLMNQPADLLLIERDIPVAYAAVQRPEPDAEGNPGPARVQEFAGSRATLAAALPGIAARYGAPAAEITVDWWDPEWHDRMLHDGPDAGWGQASVPFPGTLGVIDPARFLAAVGPVLRERAGAELRLEPRGEGAVVRGLGQELHLETMGHLTSFLFGGETEEALAVPPVPQELAGLVSRALPLPLPWYGYNYV